jgi:radical SAM superfamily enzyme YgiQ (UPF0313 family)
VRKVVLAQLPIPPAGIEPVRGNVPLAAGYLKLFAQRSGLDQATDIEILPAADANYSGDAALVERILQRNPWLVGFTCYLWNIERTLFICELLKARQPKLQIVLGGPEITSDNEWVLCHPAIDYAAIGEGEQTFAELLAVLKDGSPLPQQIDGLYVTERAEIIDAQSGGAKQLMPLPNFRRPLSRLDDVSSPYLAGILDAADEQRLLLETIRGCIFKCKFCYYPKSYDDLYFLSEEATIANLRHATERGANEVVLLDPTLNQKRDFAAFLRLLARCNPARQFTYFGELRAEGITAEIARLLREANFNEVEIGLQSIDPVTMDLMDRKNNLKAFERGARAMLDEGIRVKVDLIIGLPGDTVASVRRGLEYLHNSGLYTEVQVFNLAVLPGTAFRHEATALGLVYQDRPPYYVLETPTLRLDEMYDLMSEAQEVFETEFDPLPEPTVEGSGFGVQGSAISPRLRRGVQASQAPSSDGGLNDITQAELVDSLVVNLDQEWDSPSQLAARQSQAFTLWLRSADFDAHGSHACAIVRRLLAHNPHTTLQIVLEPLADPSRLSVATLEALRRTCLERPTYLDKFYAVMPGGWKGARRLVVVLSGDAEVDESWRESVEAYATVATVLHSVV